MQNTSLIAYEEIKDDLGRRQSEVLRLLESSDMPLCNLDISELLNWPINCVTGRVKELREAGLVEDAGVSMSPTGRPAHYWRIKKSETLF
jgi:predicted ArsR family transcriptional regulator